MFTPSKNDHHHILDAFIHFTSTQKVSLKSTPTVPKCDLKVFVLFILFNFLAVSTTLGQTVNEDRKVKRIPVSLFQTTDTNISPQDIVTGNYSFTPQKEFVRKNLSNSIFWAKLDFSNELDTLETRLNWRLRNAFAEATLYYVDQKGIDSLPFGRFNKLEGTTSLLYTPGVRFKKQELIDGKYLLIKFKSYQRIGYFRYLSDESNRFYTQYYTSEDLDTIYFHLIYLGASLIFFITFLIIYFFIRKPEFLFYSLYNFFSAIYLAGYIIPYSGHKPIYEIKPIWWLMTISQIIINLFYVLFGMYYLNTRKQYPFLHKIMQVVVPFLVLTIFAHLWVFINYDTELESIILNVQRILMSLFGLFAMVYLIIKSKDNLSYFVVIGSFVYTIGAWFYLFTLNDFYMMTGSLIEIIIFSLGLGYKIKLEYEARMALQQEVSLKEISALRAQMNPHFIFNSLSSIQNLILKNDRPAALKYLTQFGKLARNVLESSNEAVVTLSEEIALLRSYLELESLRFDNAFEYTIELDENLDSDSLEIPLMLIQPFAENAIIHGLVGKKEGLKNLMLRFKKEGPFTIIEIEDNGVGRVVSKIQAEASKKQRKSRGMEITEKRLKILNKNKVNQNKVEIVDKYDAYGNATGTKVIIQLFNP
ncbi:sensor histidine kinase [Allomuricauda sp. M10]|uniref:sensor histidine kinase n=1 Tax=Allomuricauda sp. M10 TaxID=2683292 RepID=UPI001D185E77|nr:histidine kinase [Muricauda sp. M10]